MLTANPKARVCADVLAAVEPSRHDLKALLREETEKAYKRLKKFVDSHNIFGADLEGACALGASLLQKQLEKRGIRAEIVEGYDDYGGHCWVEVDGIICDPTHEQFNPQIPWFVDSDPGHHRAYKWETYVRNPNFEEWSTYQHPLGPYGSQLLK